MAKDGQDVVVLQMQESIVQYDALVPEAHLSHHRAAGHFQKPKK